MFYVHFIKRSCFTYNERCSVEIKEPKVDNISSASLLNGRMSASKPQSTSDAVNLQ